MLHILSVKEQEGWCFVAFKGTFTTEYSELEAYANELKRSNPGSIVQVESSRMK